MIGQDSVEDPIAIIGMACRLPGGCDSPTAYWEILSEAKDATESEPADRDWDAWEDDLVAAEVPRPLRGGFVADGTGFDYAFFGITKREACAMDPQQRLALECAWSALEDARIDLKELRGSPTGVFIGCTAWYGYRYTNGVPVPEIRGHAMTGLNSSVASGRISYLLDLRGPAITVDTACSSSVVAIELAVSSMRAGKCERALVGGVSMMATPGAFMEFAHQKGLSSDGRSKSFAAGADGVGLSEGAGVLVLERYREAVQRKRRILGLIRGVAVNQDGASNGLTAPNGQAQVRVVSSALADAGITVRDIDYIEAHGTGTSLGDPVEAAALAEIVGAVDMRDRSPLLVGSAKACIGHVQAAAGVAGVIKVLLALRHDVIPPMPDHGDPNPLIRWGAGLTLARDSVPWRRGTRPRRAGVSSFGVSGTNAHVIIEESPLEDSTAAPAPATGPLLPILVSGKTLASAVSNALALSDLCATVEPDELRPLARSLAMDRQHHIYRGAAVAEHDGSPKALARALEEACTPAASRLVGIRKADRRGGPIAFIFSGQEQLGLNRSVRRHDSVGGFR